MNPEKNPINSNRELSPDNRSTSLISDNVFDDSVSFVLYDDLPPEFVEANTRYQIRGEIGQGGSGIVYRALDTKLPREVAVKVLKHKFCDRPNMVKRFIDEARIMSFLQHPGIAQVYDIGRCRDGRPFHSMKLVEGRDLFQLIHTEENGDENNNADSARLLSIFAQICQTIAYTHSRDVLHLDLKPGNVMVGLFGEVHVMDWGLSQRIAGCAEHHLMNEPGFDPPDAKIESKKQVRGTLQYMSPEQARSEPVDKRSDVFGLGSILCEILTGQPPYPGNDKQELFKRAKNAALHQALTGLEQCDSESALVRLAKRCLSPDPDHRPADASMVAHEVASYQKSALQVVENDMTRFFDLSLDLFCIAGLDGFFRRINSNFSRVLGHPEKELLSRPFMDFVHPDDHDKTINVMKDLNKGQPVVRFRNRYRAWDGSYVHFEWTAKSIPEQSIIFAVARNVSDEVSDA